MNPIIREYVYAYAVEVDWGDFFPVRSKVAAALNSVFPAIVGNQVSCHGYIRKDHDCILSYQEALKRMKKVRVSAPLRTKIIQVAQSMDCYFADEAPVLDVYVTMDGRPVTIINDDGACCFPTPFPLATWKRITETMQPEAYAQANWPKRRRMILNTIRHNLGFYDFYSEVMDNESAMRLFVDYIKRFFPELVTGLSDFLDKKAHYGLVPAKTVKAAEINNETFEAVVQRHIHQVDLYDMTYGVFSDFFEDS
ncbi:hypothetical protein [Endozoicomonas sp. YOMI1]|uniref:hypothetical protein n=1 Tax=Endozoicomonas sp. YOMI1 TaxID=2828739 RepID=UPI002147FCA7|nr:hypothetical protein [Endozoicomonas sp. YOMI1]